MPIETMTCSEYVEGFIKNQDAESVAAWRVDHPYGLELWDILNNDSTEVGWVDEDWRDTGLLDDAGDTVKISDPENYDARCEVFKDSQAGAWELLLQVDESLYFDQMVNKAEEQDNDFEAESSIYTFEDGSKLKSSDDGWAVIDG